MLLLFFSLFFLGIFNQKSEKIHLFASFEILWGFDQLSLVSYPASLNGAISDTRTGIALLRHLHARTRLRLDVLDLRTAAADH